MTSRTPVIVVAVLLIGSAIYFGGIGLRRTLSSGLASYTTCTDTTGEHQAGDTTKNTRPRDFYQCVRSDADRFLRVDYPEAKSLASVFLTLLTTVLGVSIGFAEKIVTKDNPRARARWSMIACWTMLLVAIALCGAGLAKMTSAAGFASYSPHLNYRSAEYQAMGYFVWAGLSFVFALCAVVIAAVTTLGLRSAHATADAQPNKALQQTPQTR